MCGIGGCTNAREWELAKDSELDAMSDHQVVYLAKAIEITLDDRGWMRDADGVWRLDV